MKQSGDPLEEAEKNRQAELQTLIDSLSGNVLIENDEDVVSFAAEGATIMQASSGDPLEDADKQRQEELTKLVDSLINNNFLDDEVDNMSSIQAMANTQLIANTATLQQETKTSSGDPLVDADKKRQEELNKMLDSLTSDKQVLLSNHMASGKTLASDFDVPSVARELTAEKSSSLHAMADSHQVTNTVNLAQTYGGAFILLAVVVALFINIRRRPISKTEQITENEIDCEYHRYLH